MEVPAEMQLTATSTNLRGRRRSRRARKTRSRRKRIRTAFGTGNTGLNEVCRRELPKIHLKHKFLIGSMRATKCF
jgi:hypothetical protein